MEQKRNDQFKQKTTYGSQCEDESDRKDLSNKNYT